MPALKSWRELLATPLRGPGEENDGEDASNNPETPETPLTRREVIGKRGLPETPVSLPETPLPVEKEEDIYLSSEVVGQSTVGQSRDVYATRARWSLAARGYVEVTNLATGEVVEIPHREATPVWQEDIWRLRGGRDR